MEKILFRANDGVELVGFLYKAKEKTKTVIISVHGMSSNCLRQREDVIANEANNHNIDYFCFNNRGSELVKYFDKINANGTRKRLIGGTSYENILESYEDIVGAIKKLQNLGYAKIHLQGHSLGCTKIVYTYTKLLEENNLQFLSAIKSLILLSLIDVPTMMDYYLKDKKDKFVKLAEDRIKKGEIFELMPKDSFIHSLSPETFLQYAMKYQAFDFINIIKDPALKTLNNITIPLFMRWGNVNEMILQEAGQYIQNIKGAIQNKFADIDYIYGADHSYHGKEGIIAEQIMSFIEKNEKTLFN